jgi:hypothetical protein
MILCKLVKTTEWFPLVAVWPFMRVRMPYMEGAYRTYLDPNFMAALSSLEGDEQAQRSTCPGRPGRCSKGFQLELDG